MAYIDYEFYKNNFYGNDVPEEELPKYADRASDRIDRFTFDRLADGLPLDERTRIKIQKAVCAVADALYKIDYIKKASMDNIGIIKREDGTVVNKAVSSVSSGNESISYVTGSNATGKDIYSQAAMDRKVENMLLMSIANDYLVGVTDDNGVCLLYAGMRG